MDSSTYARCCLRPIYLMAICMVCGRPSAHWMNIISIRSWPARAKLEFPRAQPSSTQAPANYGYGRFPISRQHHKINTVWTARMLVYSSSKRKTQVVSYSEQLMILVTGTLAGGYVFSKTVFCQDDRRRQLLKLNATWPWLRPKTRQWVSGSKTRWSWR